MKYENNKDLSVQFSSVSCPLTSLPRTFLRYHYNTDFYIEFTWYYLYL